MNYLRDALLREGTTQPTLLALRMLGIEPAAKTDPNWLGRSSRNANYLRDALQRDNTRQPTLLAMRMPGIEPAANAHPGRRFHTLRDKVHAVAGIDVPRADTGEVVGAEA